MPFLNRIRHLFDSCYPFILVLAIIVCTVTSLWVETAAPFVVALLSAAFGWGILRLALSQNRIVQYTATRVFFFVFAAGVVTTCLIYRDYMIRYGVPYESGGTDDRQFDETAQILAKMQSPSYSEARQILVHQGSGTLHSADNYSIFVAIVHAVASRTGMEMHTLNPRMVNCMLLAWLAVATYLLSRRVCISESGALFAGLFASLMPGMLFCAAHIYRDIFVGLGIVLCIHMAMRLVEEVSSQQGSSVRALWFTLILASCVSIPVLFRGELLIVIVVLITVIFWLRTPQILLRFAIVITSIVLIFGFLSQGGWSRLFDQATLTLTYYGDYRAAMGSESGIGTGIYRLTPVLSYPLRIVYASFVPLPVPMFIMPEDFRRIGTLIWLLFLPFLAKAIRLAVHSKPDLARLPLVHDENGAIAATLYQNAKHSSLRSVAAAFIVLYVMVAISTMHARHVTMFLPVGAVLVARGIESSRRTVGLRMGIMVAMGILLVIIYAAIKLG